MDDFDKILARIRYLADGQNVLHFRIGATDDLMDRLSDYDYWHRGYSYGQHEILAEEPDRRNILDLERRSQQAMASHLKYDGCSKHHIPSLAYDKSVYYLYFGWVDPSWQNGWEIDRELLMSIARRDPPGVTLLVRYKDDERKIREPSHAGAARQGRKASPAAPSGQSQMERLFLPHTFSREAEPVDHL